MPLVDIARSVTGRSYLGRGGYDLFGFFSRRLTRAFDRRALARDSGKLVGPFHELLPLTVALHHNVRRESAIFRFAVEGEIIGGFT